MKLQLIHLRSYWQLLTATAANRTMKISEAAPTTMTAMAHWGMTGSGSSSGDSVVGFMGS